MAWKIESEDTLPLLLADSYTYDTFELIDIENDYSEILQTWDR